MSIPLQSLPAATPSREKIARVEIGHTTVAPATVYVLLVVFLTAISVVPLIEWTGMRELIRSNLVAPVLTGDCGREGGAVGRLWQCVVSANRIVLARLNAFERGLEDESRLGRALRPRAQAAITRWLGAGNERVYPGRDGWLFYRPDVEFVTGPGFLDRSQLERRVAAAAEWNAPPTPDPREAIVSFKRDLEARGITLIVMPTPIKPAVHPEMLALRYADTDAVLQNPSYRTFVEDLGSRGVLVFDPSDALAARRRTDAQYLATDTHWRAEAMEAIAELVGSFITARIPLPPAADPGYRVARVEVQNRGDIARMLDLPEDHPLFPPETVWLRRILQPDGGLWRPSPGADVLVLGDSFSNVYTLESMGWGTSAGFVEQLSYALGRPVDRLVQNDEGAFATRAILQRDPARLEGTRVVVYQFAMRELAFGDWRALPLPK
jgi:alginate O-acetyltransferase complex protein AlgJ